MRFVYLPITVYCCIALLLLTPAHAHPQAITVGDITIEPGDFSPDRSPETRTAKCLACHGQNAGGDIDFGPEVQFGTPALRGIQEGYLKQALIDYATGLRQDDEMNAVASMLEEETIEFMTRTFAGFPVPPLKSEAERARLAEDDQRFRAGWSIAREGRPADGVPACATCHGTSWDENEALGPHLAGQNSLYIRSQLEAFAGKTRQTAHADLMQPVVMGLSSDEIEAVAYFYERIVELKGT